MKLFKYIIYFFILKSVSLNAQNFLVELKASEADCDLATAAVNVILATSPVTYTWSTGSHEQSIKDLTIGSYWVKIVDANSNDTIINFEITGITCLPVPETHFTPNGDDFNDTWDITLIERFPDFSLYVYNRWGQLIHQQKNDFKTWDGKHLSLPLPDATYYYVLYTNKSDKNSFIKGTISIIR